ncbi:MAG: hypothetical protein LBS23_01215, partial [Holosporaceae bacterium]|nr:hypothetical protein [Holosporaceae bacterium]
MANRKIISVYDKELEKTVHFYKESVGYRLSFFGPYMSYLLKRPIDIEVSDNLDEITKSEVLICPTENCSGPMYEKLLPWLQENNFATVAQANAINVFATRELRPLKLPFFYSFRLGSIKADLIFTCFGSICDDGAISITKVPVIKFKVANMDKNLLVEYTVLRRRDTFEEETVVFQVFANNQMQTSFTISRNSSRKVDVFVPKDLIGRDGIVCIKFVALGDLKIEDINRRKRKEGLI